MAKEIKEPDILDEIKKVEKITKAQLLRKAIKKIKDYAREIVELKEKTQIELEEIGIKDEDIKRVIDFVNSLPDVQLTENDKKDLRDSVKKSVQSEKKDVEKEIEDKGIDLLKFTTNSDNLTWSTQSTSSGYSVNLCSSSNSTSIKL